MKYEVVISQQKEMKKRRKIIIARDRKQKLAMKDGSYN